MNAKIGKDSMKSIYKGYISKSYENKNGSLLKKFLAINNLTAPNTLLRHSAKNPTTWQGKLNNKMPFNTIDYIITHKKSSATLKTSQ